MAAIVLLGAGYARWQAASGSSALFALALLAAGALLLIVAGRELRGIESRHAGSLNLVAGAALLTEWAVTVADRGRLFRPTLLAGLLSIGLGLFHHRLGARQRNRRVLRVDDEGVSFRLNVFRRFQVRWSELASISIEPSEILLARRDGGFHRIPLARLANADEVREAIRRASVETGIGERAVVRAG